MAVLHFFGGIFRGLAFIFLALGVFVWLDGRATLPAGRVWFETHFPSLGDAEVIVSRPLVAPEIWLDKALPSLTRLAWGCLPVPGRVCLTLCRLPILICRGRRRCR